MPDPREEELRDEIETCITDLKQGLVEIHFSFIDFLIL